MILDTAKKYVQKHIYLIWGICLFLLITGTGWFFAGKTVFLLDYVPTPLYIRDRSFYISNPFIRTLHDAAIYLLGHTWGSKIYLGSIFFLSVYLAYLRGNWIGKEFFNHESRNIQQRIVLLTMLVFVCNPFFSARYGTQPGIWLSILFLGFGIFKVVTHRDNLQRRHICAIGIYRGVALMSMAHASFMILLLLGSYLLFNFRKKKTWIHVAGIATIVFFLNVNRLLGSPTLQIVSSGNEFDEQNIHEFATYEHSGLGPIATAAFGYGFRGEKYGSAFVPTTVNARRWLAGLILMFFALCGLHALYKKGTKERFISYRTTTIIVFALILGVGISSDLLAPLTNFLYEFLPAYRGLREPQKRIGLYMMVMLPLMILGRGKSVGYTKRFVPLTLYAITFCCILIAWTPGVFNAMKGRYIMVNYPTTYEQTRTQLLLSSSLSPRSRVHLPRHSYHQCDRTKKVVANTLQRFFIPLDVITADNIEIGNLYTNSNNQLSKDIELFLQTRDISLLKKHAFGGIIFTKKCADYKNYERVKTITGVEKVIDNDDISIYTFK